MLDCQSQTLVIGSLSNVEMVAKIWETLQLEESEAKKNKSNVKLIVEKGITGDLYQDCCSYIHSKDNLSLPLYQGFIYQANFPICTQTLSSATAILKMYIKLYPESHSSVPFRTAQGRISSAQ